MYTFFAHTADIGIDLRAASLDELFVEAARAFWDSILELDALRADDALAIELVTADTDLLLVDWLSELLYHFDTAGFVGRDASITVEPEGAVLRLRATVRGERGAAARLPVKVLVKGITYHQLRVAETPDGWEARVILDI
ncbi:MAG TPA: archease [Vicinamibacterales bacterium]|jgi:SHS2 domain-containing protein